METKKSFVGLESAYSFFLKHSSQLSRAIDAATLIVAQQKFPREKVRVCFLGCGDIELALHLVQMLKPERTVDVTLVDAHSEWLAEAERKVRRAQAGSVSACRALAEACAPFDLIVAHHTMYYVPDLTQALGRMHQLLAHDGILVTALASRSNKLKQCAVELFKLRGEKLPYWQEEDLETELLKAGFQSEAVAISSAVSCADTTAARTALINFLMGTLEPPSQEDLQVFAPYQDGVRLHVPMTDTVLVSRHA